MKQTKILLLLAFTVMLIVPIAYAGWFTDWVTGWQTGTRPTNLTITVGNTDPLVTFVENLGTQTVNEYPNAALNITFEVHVYDGDGVGNLNTTGTSANVSLWGASAVRSTPWCNYIGDLDGNTANFTCSIEVLYYDTPGWWNITAHGKDISHAGAVNDTGSTFQLQDTTAIRISPDEVTFPGSNPGSLNVSADNDPSRINNTANHNISSNDLTVTAIDLYGADPNYWIPAANFSVGINDSACDNPAGVSMVNGSAESITGYVLEAGDLDAGEAYEEIYYCITQIPPGVSSQTYDTSTGGSWNIIAS